MIFAAPKLSLFIHRSLQLLFATCQAIMPVLFMSCKTSTSGFIVLTGKLVLTISVIVAVVNTDSTVLIVSQYICIYEHYRP